MPWAIWEGNGQIEENEEKYIVNAGKMGETLASAAGNRYNKPSFF